MNVRELRAALDEYPDDLPIAVDGYEGGFTENVHLRQVDVRPNVHTEWYYGEHEEVNSDTPPEGHRTLLLLARR